jgi:hypothetical protein
MTRRRLAADGRADDGSGHQGSAVGRRQEVTSALALRAIDREPGEVGERFQEEVRRDASGPRLKAESKMPLAIGQSWH